MAEQQKKNKNKPKGPVVRQFEWFQMETKVRKIIQEIVNPVQEQMVQNRFRFQDLKKKDSSFQQKIEYLLKMITNDPNIFKLGIFKSIQDKFQQQQKVITFLTEQVKNNSFYIQDKIKLIDQRMKQSNNVIQEISMMKISNRQMQQTQATQFNMIRLNIQKNLQSMVNSIQDNQKYNRQKQENIQKQTSKIKMEMEKIKKQFDDIKLQASNQKFFNQSLKQNQLKSQNFIQNIQQELLNHQQRLKGVQKMKYFVTDMQNSFNKLQFKVDNILPLINEAQINQCLYKIMPNKFHPRIAVYEFHKYMELNEIILNKVFQTQSIKLNLNGQGMIRQSQQRNTKLLTKLKRSYLIKQGHELDFIAYEERERLLNDFNYQKLCQICQQMEQLQNQKEHMKKKQHKLGQQEIRAIVEDKFQNDRKHLLQKIKIQMSDSKKYLQDFQANLFKEIQAVDKKCQQSKAKLYELQKQYTLKCRLDNQCNKRDRNEINLLIEEITSIKQLTKSVYNYCVIANRVEMQKQNLQTSKSHQNNLHYSDQKSKRRIHSNLIQQSSNSQSESQKDGNFENVLKIKDSEGHKFSMPQLLNLQATALTEARMSYQSLMKPINKTTAVQSQLTSKTSKRHSFSRTSKIQLPLFENQVVRNDIIFNNQQQANQNPEKKILFSQSGGFLKVPIHKKQFITKNNRYCNTSRAHRKQGSMTPSKSCFIDEKNKKNEMKQALQLFSQLKKNNKKYLK